MRNLKAFLLRLRFKFLPIVMHVLLRPRAPSELRMIHLGSAYGGWWVPSNILQPGAVAYCGGAGEDITFDLALFERGMTVRTFDPTPRAISHVATNAPAALSFSPVGWWSHSDTLKFFAPRNPTHVSHSAVNIQATDDFLLVPVQSVRGLADEFGDRHISLIKMDIEGAEYVVVDSLLQEGPLPDVLLIDFDQPIPAQRTIHLVRRLRSAGLSLVKIDLWNYTFVRLEAIDNVGRA